VDLSEGPRRFRFLFVHDGAAGQAYIRIKSESGQAVSVRQLAFGSGRRGRRLGTRRPTRVPHICVRWGATPDGVQLYEFPGAVPLARIAPRASVVPDLSEAIERLLADDPSDDAAVPALYEWRPEWGEPPPIGGAGAVRLERSAGNELVALADCPSPALLVINQAFDPGWSARVDGKPLRILRVNAVVQGVVVPPGFVAGRLPVSAPGLLAGGCISAAAALLLAGGCLWPRRPGPPPDPLLRVCRSTVGRQFF